MTGRRTCPIGPRPNAARPNFADPNARRLIFVHLLATSLALAPTLAAFAQTDGQQPDAGQFDGSQTDGGQTDPFAPLPLVLDPVAPPAGALPSADGSATILTPQIAPHAATPLTNAQSSTAPAATPAPGAVLRGLDRVAGTTTDLTVRDGQSVTFGTLAIAVTECRYPTDNPASDAYAHLKITETARDQTRTDPAAKPLFDGWMIASSPALSALDHPRYDVWVLACAKS